MTTEKHKGPLEYKFNICCPLDVLTSDFIREYLINFQRKNKSTILITSHNLIEIEKMCSHLIILDEGNIFFKGKLKSLMKENNYSSLKDFFLKNK